MNCMFLNVVCNSVQNVAIPLKKIFQHTGSLTFTVVLKNYLDKATALKYVSDEFAVRYSGKKSSRGIPLI